ncbi:MAG: VOC family protein [Chloroflexota bacterium]|nr:VOC family protein [Chloroflexota bacterium]MDE2883486.1 VOC family protein [Chloroflexota bacterium]
MQKITPCLWFNDKAEEAVNLYTSVFPNSEITSVTRYGEPDAEVSGQPEGSVQLMTFTLEGLEFTALNGGPMYQFSPAISLQVTCKTQDEIDAVWEQLSEDGEEEMCGWLRDRFGVSWQVMPESLGELLGVPEPARTRVWERMLQMRKIDIAALREAAEG